jgi:hypothetical protein
MTDGRTFLAALAFGTALAPAAIGAAQSPPAREGDRAVATRVAAEPPAAPPAADPESIREERELAHRRRHLPEPMTAREIALLGEKLALDAKGRERLAELAAEYDATWDALREKDGRAMLVLLPASFSYDHRSQDLDPVHTPELLAFLRLRERHLAAVAETEARLWRELEGLTAARSARFGSIARRPCTTIPRGCPPRASTWPNWSRSRDSLPTRSRRWRCRSRPTARNSRRPCASATGPFASSSCGRPRSS